MINTYVVNDDDDDDDVHVKMYAVCQHLKHFCLLWFHPFYVCFVFFDRSAAQEYYFNVFLSTSQAWCATIKLSFSYPTSHLIAERCSTKQVQHSQGELAQKPLKPTQR